MAICLARMISAGVATFGSTLTSEQVDLAGLVVRLAMIMGDYFRVGFMMNAVDQHLPPTREALLPR